MELDEFKKSWNALDQHLKQKPIASEQQIAELIATCKSNANKSMNRLLDIQRTGMIVSVLVLTVLLFLWIPPMLEDVRVKSKVCIFFAFMCASIIGGIGWDWKTYRWNRQIRVDEMSVTEVNRRMQVLHRWTRLEVYAVSIWALLLNILNYWLMDYHQKSAGSQILLIVFLLAIDVILIYLFYKKMVYKHLNNIKKNVEELEEICTK